MTEAPTRCCHPRSLRTWSDADAIADERFCGADARASWRSRAQRSRRLTWTPGGAARGDGSPAAARGSICGARWRAACGPAATSRRCRAGGAGSGRARSCCCAMSAARWSATRARCCTSRMRCRDRPSGRSLPVRDAADAHHHGTANAAGRRRHCRRVARGARLVRRHADRRRAARPSINGGAGAAARRPGRAADFRRLGSRRSRRAARRDRAPAAQLSSADLAEPADRHAGFRAVDAGPAGGAAVRG